MRLEIENNQNYWKNNFEEVRGLTRQHFFRLLMRLLFMVGFMLASPPWA